MLQSLKSFGWRINMNEYFTRNTPRLSFKESPRVNEAFPSG